MNIEKIEEISKKNGFSKELVLSFAEALGISELEIILEDYFLNDFFDEEAEEALY
jgi:hypothetical protein